VDLVAADMQAAARWLQANEHRFGVTFPVSWESPEEFTDHFHAEMAKVQRAAERTAPAIKRVSEAERAAATASRQAASAVEGLIRQYLPAEAAGRQLQEAQLALALAGDAAGLSQEQQSRILQALQNDLDDAARAMDEAAQEAGPFEEMWTGALEEIGRSVQSSLVDAFKDAFDGTLKTARDALDRLKDIVLNALANLAAQVAARPILVGIGAVMGQMGMSGAAQAMGLPAAGGGIGGIGGIPGVGQALGAVGGIIGGALNYGAAALSGASIAGGLGSQAAMLAAQTGAFGMSGAAATASALGTAGGIGGALGAVGSAIGAALPVVGPLLAIGAATGLFDGLFGGGRKKTTGQGSVYGGEFTAYDNAGAGLYTLADDINQALDQLEQQLGDAAADARDAFTRVGTVYKDNAQAAADQMKAMYTDIVKAMVGAYTDDLKREIREDAIDAAGGESLINAGAFVDKVLSEAFRAAGDDPAAITQAAQQATAYIRGVIGFVTHQAGTFAADALGKDLALIQYNAERIGQSFDEMVGNLQTWSQMSIAMGKSVRYGIEQGWDPAWMAKATAEMGEMAGGMQALQQGLAIYMREFMTVTEREAAAMEQARSMLDAQIPDWQDIAPTRDAYIALVEAQDRTTEEGRKMLATLLRLAGVFDQVYDAAERAADALAAMEEDLKRLEQEQVERIERFVAAIAPAQDGRKAWETLNAAAASVGKEMPRTTEALYAMVQAGELTADQMLWLAERMDLLTEAMRYQEEVTQFIDSLAPPLDGERAWRELQAAAASVNKQMPETAAQLHRMIELGMLSDAEIDYLMRHQEELRAAWAYLEEEAAEAERAMQRAIEARREDTRAQYDAQVDALRRQQDAVREWQSTASQALSSITGAIGQFATQAGEYSAIAFERARRQLRQLADAGRLPDQRALETALEGLTRNTGVYATADAERIARARIRSDLEALESVAENQVDRAEQQLNALTRQAEMLEHWRDEQLARLDALAEAPPEPEQPIARPLPALSAPTMPESESERRSFKDTQVLLSGIAASLRKIEKNTELDDDDPANVIELLRVG